MKFFSVVLFASLSSSAYAQSGSENIEISDFTVQQAVDSTGQVTGVDSVSFTINGSDKCSAQNPGVTGEEFTCGGSAFSFGLFSGVPSEFGLSIIKSAGSADELNGNAEIPTNCAAGGDVSSCSQSSPITVTLTSQNSIKK